MKFALVAAIAILMILGRRLHVQRQLRLQKPQARSPRVPRELLDGADRTWVVFTTPFCAACGPVKEQLASDDPMANIVTIDATREPHLADAFGVRTAPTVLLAGADGEVEARLVGAPAVRDYFARSA